MTELDIVFLGTSAAIPTPDRGLSSILIIRGNEYLLFDAGEGVQKNFIRSNLSVNKKMRIFFTHSHGDHCIGVLGILQTLSLMGRNKDLDIYCESRIKDFIISNVIILDFKLNFNITINIIKEGIIVTEKEYQIRCCRSNHSVLSYAYCIEEYSRPGIFNIEILKKLNVPEGEMFKKLQNGEDIIYNGKKIKSTEVTGPRRKGRKIAISGDTRPSESLEKFFLNADILIYDSTFSNKEYEKAVYTFHSTSAEAAEMALRSKSSMLILTHFSARYSNVKELIEEAKHIFSNVYAAEDLMRIRIPLTNNKIS